MLAVTDALSATCTVKLKIPEPDGVPRMVPELGSILRPPGRAPVTIEKWYGLTPPDTPIICEYPEPAAPGGSVGGVVIVRAGAMVSVIGSIAMTDALSVTFTVKLKVPEAVGVPPTTPVALLSVKPLGGDPDEIDQV